MTRGRKPAPRRPLPPPELSDKQEAALDLLGRKVPQLRAVGREGRSVVCRFPGGCLLVIDVDGNVQRRAPVEQ